MGAFSSISKLIFREYDRRIKRASLITEYGANRHSHSEDHDERAEFEHSEPHEDGGAEIVNIPRGTPVDPAKH